MCSHVHLYEVDHFRLECMCRQLGAVVCGQKGLKKLTEYVLNLVKLGVEPWLGILSFVGGELLGRQLLQMQIDFFVFYICFEVDSIDLWPCGMYLSHSTLQLPIYLSL